MSIETLAWVRVAHVFGFIVWIGGMLACMSLLHVHTLVEAGARAALTRVEKGVAMLMDTGAALAIAAGFTMAFEQTPIAFKTGAWLHVKLTIVVLVILSSHGMVRAKIKKFSKGEIKPLPRWLFTAVLAAVAVIVALGAEPDPAPQVILHVDLDAFFAAVEQRDDPKLRGKPVIVGGSARRGVVAACSYEARVFGVHSAMPMAVALRLCPQAIVVKHHMERYADASHAFMAILGDFTPEVEPLSFDEAFLDVTGCERLLGDARTIGLAIKQRVRAQLALVASVGAAPIKLAAKIASDIDKPDGLRVVTREELVPFLHALPTWRLWGVGEVTRTKLETMGLRTIGDIARYPEAALIARFGETWGPHLAALARGEDPRHVERADRPVSVGHRETFEHDHGDPHDLELVLLHQADRVGARLRRAGLRAGAVVLYVKYDDFRQISRQKTLPDPSSDGAVIARTALELLGHVDIEDRKGKRVRLVGVAATSIEDRDAPRQLTLDEPIRARGERLGDALDGIRDKFGDGAVKRAVHLSDDLSDDDD